MKKNWLPALALYGLIAVSAAMSQQKAPIASSGNQQRRLEWFQDQGFGIFIHWSVDSQLGVVISHSLVDASPEYTDRFFHELPKTFVPSQFDANTIARLIRVSGAKYSVFTAKHHSGFAMFNTSTTNFGVMETPLHRDLTAEMVSATRRQGIATGIYYSPDDFLWLWQHNVRLAREVPEVSFAANPGLLRYDQAQLRELLTHYGKVDMLFLDGEAAGLRELAWKLQPSIVVTRGAMETPEQKLPDAAIPGPWEACITIGSAWQYQPQREIYKSGAELIRLLVETRARGGNLLLNIGPKANGEIPIEEEDRLREIGLWMFVNGEAIYGVRPWSVTHEGDVWFTRAKEQGPHGESTVYAIVQKPWKRGTWLDLTLHSMKSTAQTEVTVLGQKGEVLEYSPKVDPRPSLTQKEDGLHIHAMRTQRLQDAGDWPHPAVLRITHVLPASAN